MGITISSNRAVQQASFHLADAQKKFQMSIRRLASGKRIIGANEDPGTLAVAMKTRSQVNQLVGAANNVRSGISFLEIQDGLLDTAGRILMRMSELKGYSTQDPLKSDDDYSSYNNEFKDLQYQLYDISTMEFNKQKLFSDESSSGGAAYFGGKDQVDDYANTISIYTSSSGSDGSKAYIHRSLFLSALVIENKDENRNAWLGSDANSDATDTTDTKWSSIAIGKDVTAEDLRADKYDTTSTDHFINGYVALASNSASHQAISLGNVRAETLEAAVENIVFLRSQTGGSMSRMQFAIDSIATQETNMRSALGRIEDVDMATESANLAKYGILMQASAAMVTQANLTNEVSLSLIRGM
jgi:flagellin-like hook-associated protein FlgL